MDVLNEIHVWGLATLNDTEHWNNCIRETIRRSNAGSRSMQKLGFNHPLGLVYDEYIFYFSNEEDAALFKLVWT